MSFKERKNKKTLLFQYIIKMFILFFFFFDILIMKIKIKKQKKDKYNIQYIRILNNFHFLHINY